MSDATTSPAQRRARWAVALLVVGLVVAFVPGLSAGHGFLAPKRLGMKYVAADPDPLNYRGRSTTPDTDLRVPPVIVSLKFQPIASSLTDLVMSDVGWAVAVGTLVLAPLAFALWRRTAISFVPTVAVASCTAAGAAVALMVHLHARSHGTPTWVWTTIPLGGALMAAAFLVAPVPSPRDDV